MSTTRRAFMVGMSASALFLMTGAPRALARSMTIAGVRYGMLHDEAACIGCTACVDACREVNQVPEGVTRLQILRSGPQGEYPDQTYQFFRKSCQHCDNAPCVHVCPTGASHIRAEDGIVDINPDLCVGCRYCLAACPYQVRFINPVSGVADKCDFCRQTNLANGKQPACVEACPTRALVFGNLDDPQSPIARRLAQENSYRDKELLGTSPKLYRIRKIEETKS
ncbi:4Fe-4S dicluster domain-containing protein [Aeromonas sp. MdU4]|uniref:4Fe-4S dicluster domain-containing protein n=1 Tax=Aeromonas sp. MdU4 TaxID=3342819 RepID=UPI0035B74A18